MTQRRSAPSPAATSSANMANYILCVLLVFLNIVYGTPSIKGLFCQDPDTGKLYPINSTWQSESFCGNYTCKLKKKNVTETEYMPITKINITKKDNFPDDMSTSPSENSLVVMTKGSPDKQPVYHKETYREVSKNSDEINNENNDRYLTEAEIKTITEVLRTIKKSDLEAIVEIYNLAQEIYNEMDSTTTEKMDKETVNSMNDENETKSSGSKNSLSYWYEPLYYHNKKVSPADLKIEGTYIVPTTRSYPYPVPYLNRPFSEKAPMRVPYYYPMSQFQRMSSYMHNPYNMQAPEPPKPCNKHKNMNNIPYYPQELPKQPIPLLPYPFSYVHHYNSTYPASYYYNSYPWSQLDIYNRQKMYPQPYGTHLKTPNTIAEKNDELKETDEQNNIQEDIVLDDEVSDVPEWQTEPLSSKILNEVKANILEKSKLLKPLSLRKKVKLEKVGKVINIDELKRPKRSVINIKDKGNEEDEKYEAYVVKTTCESEILVSSEPAYFRVGNESQPYPACCPQRIKRIKS